jgi:hypothetical protein
MRRSGLQSRRFNLIPVSIFLFLIIFSIPTVAFSQRVKERVKELQQLPQQRIENGVSQQRRSEIIEQIVDYYCNNNLGGTADIAGANPEIAGAAGFSDSNVEKLLEHFEKLLRSRLM